MKKIQIKNKKILKICFDCGNGSTGNVVNSLIIPLQKRIYEKYATEIEVRILFGEIDGSFPNHHPDPTVLKNMEDLKNFVLKNHFLSIGKRLKNYTLQNNLIIIITFAILCD